MPQALFAGDEPVPVRTDHAPVLQGRAVEDLEAVARRIREPDHLVHPAIREFGSGGLLVRGALHVQPVSDLLQSLSIRALPAGFREPVVLTGDDDQPGREIVHPQIQRTLGGTLTLDHAEHLEAVFAPGRHVGGLDAQISQRTDAHLAPPRKSIVSRLNSSNFSTCAQCPHCPKTCNCARGIVFSATSAPSSGLTRSSRPQMSSTGWRSWYTSRHIMPSSKSAPANDIPIARVAVSDSGVLANANRCSTSSGVMSFLSYTITRRK